MATTERDAGDVLIDAIGRLKSGRLPADWTSGKHDRGLIAQGRVPVRLEAWDEGEHMLWIGNVGIEVRRVFDAGTGTSHRVEK